MCMLLDCFCLVTVACACKPFFSEVLKKWGRELKCGVLYRHNKFSGKVCYTDCLFFMGEGALRYILVSVSRLGLKLNLVK